MLRLNELKPAPGSHHRRKVVGRGEGSGHGGKGSTRGFKGQTARSGDKSLPPGFEGGQMPLMRRAPKRGFNNKDFHTFYETVNVGDLGRVFSDGAEVTAEALKAARLVRKDLPVKILGDGELGKKLTVKVNKFSASAKEKIEKAGGTVTVLSWGPTPYARPKAKV
jgi:large subunit ribosomal protein L15